MKNFKIILALAIGFIIGGIGMQLSKTYGLGNDFKQWEADQKLITSKIAERYIQVHGSPTEKWQQCELDFIVYDDVTNCEP